ncbi:maleylacetoacetate isomerase [Aestuariibacter salexigens]|uniref:maleylacetoacetate isomerase n=1 Tax=Aestuariibacter salexigens TaxID=226010 RepID=UPI000421AFE4|nr:maleylacetoacetate isomerase [Aestuariibacter salexigens]
MSIKLFSYWRSSASYRVRIALNLKQLDYHIEPVHLVKEGGQQHSEAYGGINPSHLVPTFFDEDEDVILNQSLAIIEYVDEKHPQPVKLIPEHKLERARVRALSYDLACDIQPLANLRVLQHIGNRFDATQEDKAEWAKHWITTGFKAVEKRLQNTAGDYCFGFDVTMADVCLVPQYFNAKRFNVDLQAFPTIQRVCENCQELDAFIRAQPENQPDAE